jgi:uncharacterized membrane protein affecting hemolysin expression
MEPNQQNQIYKINNNSRKKLLFIIFIIILLTSLAYLYFRQKNTTPVIDPRLVELQKLKDSSAPDNTTTQQKLDTLQGLEKSSKTTQVSADARLQELNNLSKQ